MKKPIILAIETSTEACSAALSVGELLFCRHEITEREHTRLLLPMIQSLLKEARVDLPEIEAIAVGRGPGSFTGVRVGVSCAQGLGFALSIPVYTVSTLEALAYSAKIESKLPCVIVPAIDARMQEIYTCAYLYDQNLWKMVFPETVCKPGVLKTYLSSLNQSIVGVGSGWDVYSEALLQEMNVSIELKTSCFPNASHVAMIAKEMHLQGHPGQLAQDVLPVYLRDKVV